MRLFALIALLLASTMAGAACTQNTVIEKAGAPTPASADDAGDDAGDPDAGPPAKADAGKDAAPEAAPSYPASFGPAPQVGSSGGMVLATPSAMAITFDSDALRPQIEQFMSTVGATSWWKSVASEYGIGVLTGATPVHLTGETAPTTIADADIQTYLAGKLDGTHPEFGAPSPSTIYTIFYPETTTITAPVNASGSGTSCTNFGGYHNELTLPSGMNIVYAVIPRCADFYSLNGIDMVTGATSHELLEAATDPYVVTSPAYSGTDDEGVAFELFLGGGEVGDMCVQTLEPFFTPPGFSFIVQRGWSNKAATAGHDPCVPSVGGPYFNAAPQMKDTITFSNGGTSTPIKGIKVPIGTSKTVDVDLFSDAPTGGDFSIVAYDYASLYGGSPGLTLSLDRSSGHDGQIVHLTITTIAMGTYGVAPFILESTLNGRTTMWAGLVGQ